MEDFNERLATVENNTASEPDVVSGALYSLEKKFSDLKQDFEVSEPVRKGIRNHTADELKQRLATLLNKAETAVSKATSLKQEVAEINKAFDPLTNKWNTAKDCLLSEAYQVENAPCFNIC